MRFDRLYITQVASFSGLAGSKVFYLILVLLITAMSLIVVLWAGTFFFQGYIYTEPSPGLYWQAPVTGAALTVGYAIWCGTIFLAKPTRPTDIPINTIFFFTAKEDMFERPLPPAAKLWAIKLDRQKTGDDKDGERTEYKRVRDGQDKYHYEDTTTLHRPWHAQDVIAVEMEKDDGTKMRFDLAKTGKGENRQYISSDGWVMTETVNGPTGNPEKFRFGRLLLNVLFNLVHLAAWFVLLWLLMRYQWPHALGLGAALWLVITLALLPMLLEFAANASLKSR